MISHQYRPDVLVVAQLAYITGQDKQTVRAYLPTDMLPACFSHLSLSPQRLVNQDDNKVDMITETVRNLKNKGKSVAVFARDAARNGIKLANVTGL